MKKVLKNLGYIALVTFGVAIFTLFWLRFYTKHNEDLILVPEVIGAKNTIAEKKLNELGLQVEFADTTYKDGAQKLSVISQNPPQGTKVKRGRKIYLVINGEDVPMVEVPDLAGKTSLNQARSILARRGIKLGRIIEYELESVKSKLDAPVLKQFVAFDTIPILPGALIERNSSIDIVIGVPIREQLIDSTSY